MMSSVSREPPSTGETHRRGDRFDPGRGHATLVPLHPQHVVHGAGVAAREPRVEPLGPGRRAPWFPQAAVWFFRGLTMAAT